MGMRQFGVTFLVFACGIFLQSNLFGQKTKLGIKAGVTFPQSQEETLTLIDPLDTYHHDLSLTETPYGLRAGLFLRIPINKVLYIQPEAIFSLQSTMYQVSNLKNQNSALLNIGCCQRDSASNSK